MSCNRYFGHAALCWGSSGLASVQPARHKLARRRGVILGRYVTICIAIVVKLVRALLDLFFYNPYVQVFFLTRRLDRVWLVA